VVVRLFPGLNCRLLRIFFSRFAKLVYSVFKEVLHLFGVRSFLLSYLLKIHKPFGVRILNYANFLLRKLYSIEPLTSVFCILVGCLQRRAEVRGIYLFFCKENRNLFEAYF
jgi:hypothetical protein